MTTTAATWKRIGRIERIAEGLKIITGDHVAYITREDLSRITRDRYPGNVCTIEETGNELVITNVGKAYRSRSGRALVVRVPWQIENLITPWAHIQNIMAGKQQAAPVSIMQTPTAAREVQQQSTTSITAGLEMCF